MDLIAVRAGCTFTGEMLFQFVCLVAYYFICSGFSFVPKLFNSHIFVQHHLFYSLFYMQITNHGQVPKVYHVQVIQTVISMGLANM